MRLNLMAVVWIPSLLHQLSQSQGQVNVPGQTVGQVIDALDAIYPGLKARLCRGNRLHPTLIVTVDGRVGRLGLLEPVVEQSELHFLPVVAGG
jgi:molybdopterin synthase sulfur carrier subunit